MTKPRFSKIVKSGQDLQMGCYMVQVDHHGRASVIPITTKESKEIIKTILGRVA